MLPCHLHEFPRDTTVARPAIFSRNRIANAHWWFIAAVLAIALPARGHSIASAADPSSTPPHRLERFEFSQPEMGVNFKIVLYAPDEATATKAARAAFQKMGELNAILSDYDPNSELSRLSDTAGSGRWVTVSEPLWHVLQHSQQFWQESEGAFDVTVGQAVGLWRIARRAKRLPPPDDLQAARATIGFQHMEFNRAEHSVRLNVKGTRLDLGGIAKGYAADEALRAIRQQGWSRALVDGGGDISLGDAPPDKTGWRIGVAPLDVQAAPSQFLTLSNCAVATSGDAFQALTIQGKRYSHILDPKTGIGLTNHSSVTVIAADGLAADALASSVSVLGPEHGRALVDRWPHAAALIVRQEGDRVVTYSSKRWPASPPEPMPR